MTKQPKLEIVTKHLSPPWLKVIAALIFLATNFKVITLSFMDVNPVVFLLGNLLAIVIWTGREIVIIDFDNHLIEDGYMILWLRYTNKMHYTSFEKVFINRVLYSQKFNHRASVSTIHDEIYKAFLKTSEGEKICIGMSRDKDKLIKMILQHNAYLKTIVIDNTTAEPVIIADAVTS